MNSPLRIWSIGHSTLLATNFMDLLRQHGLELVADVRHFPSSRRHPHFRRDAPAASLAQVGIDYLHFPKFSGRREPRPDSINTGWREATFRGYADNMQTAPIIAGIVRVLESATSRQCAMMCPEKAWRNYHRRLTSDVLKLSGYDVNHIVDRAHAERHPYTQPARVVDGMLSYPAETPAQSRFPM